MQARAACLRRGIDADQELIEDLVCDVSVHLLNDNCRRMKVWLADPRAPFEHFVAAVVANCLRNRMSALSRLKHREAQLEEDTAPDIAEEHDDGTQLAVRIFLDKLPSEYKQVLVMRYCDGLSSSKIAQKMRLPLKSVYALTHKAKREMRRLLEEDIGDAAW